MRYIYIICSIQQHSLITIQLPNYCFNCQNVDIVSALQNSSKRWLQLTFGKHFLNLLLLFFLNMSFVNILYQYTYTIKRSKRN